MKKCQHCGSFCLDADVVCGICGRYIANTPALKGSIEDEVLRDGKEAERRSTLLKEKLARESKRRFARRLLVQITAIAIGSATVIYGIVNSSSLGYAYRGSSASLVDISALGAGFLLIIIGLSLRIRGGTLGSLPIERSGGGRPTPAGPSSPRLSAVSNLSMKATYEGPFVPKE